MAKLWRWRRRSEGFEWHKYVRTTIALRREHRREKAEEIKRSAADGAVRAKESAIRMGRQGASAAGEGARRLSASTARGLRNLLAASGRALRVGSAAAAQGLWSGSVYAGAGVKRASAWAGRTSSSGAQWAGRHLATVGRAAGWGLVEAGRPVIEFLGRPGVSGPLLLAGAVALLSGLGRPFLTGGGVDREAILVSTIGAVCLLGGLAPRLRYGPGAAILAAITAPFRRLPTGSGRVVAGASAVVAAIWAAVWFIPSHVSVPSMSLSSFVPFQASEPPITGRASALAADTLRIGTTIIRIDGIEALERQQTCARTDNRRWRCGEAARSALSRMVAGREVTCEPGGKDASGIVRATCRIGKTDIGAALVQAGHVFADSAMLARYRSEQNAAREAKAGIWSGSSDPERPAAWRARLWQAARAKAPDGCPIKGKVASRRGGGAKTYHLPWSPGYLRLRVVSSRGERWFCSEDDAKAAGFAPSGVDG